MKYGLIGKSLPHSYSKIIHEFLGNQDYKLHEIPPEAVENFLREADFNGINVTIPYKETVIPFCIPDDTAKKIGSVNTIINKNKTLYGYNTDYSGFLFMIKNADISLEGKKVLVLGSGGTSKTAVCAAQDSHAKEVVIVSRFGKNNYENIGLHTDSDVLINTTPAGMFPNNGQSPLSLRLFKNLSAVVDVIYNPLRTKLLLEAQETGVNTANGLSMLAAQALYAHNLFFNIETDEYNDDAKIKEILQKTERRFSNIILIGMPGCGKTTIGKKLAEILKMNFVDTDLMIEANTGRKVQNVIREDGEPVFRELENGVIAQVTVKTGQVIATGGGSVLAKKNREALLQNGIIFFLEREVEKLATSERPLSTDLYAMYCQRLPLYESLCRYKINANVKQEDIMKKITDVLS